MKTITMADIAPLCGIPYPAAGRNSVNIRCPKCDRPGGRKHLHIDFAKNVFRCPKCNWNGGIFDLFSQYTGVPRESARESIYNLLDSGVQASRERWIPSRNTELPIAPLEVRHQTYSALLSLLELTPDHYENLRKRGLSEEVIYRNQYKSTLAYGFSAIAKKLLDDGFQLAGVPGFYQKADGNWALAESNRGFYIPVRTRDGAIQGLQIRLDKAVKRKYRWLSSAEFNHGTPASVFCHVAGPEQHTMILTEGPLKADVIYHLSGDSVIAVPGVTSLHHLQPLLLDLQKRGLEKVMTAYDMDLLDNPNVKEANIRLGEMLNSLGIDWGLYYWPREYKGLDDYLLSVN